MQAKLNASTILANLPTEEQLSELSPLESLYAIRKLKALSDSLQNGFIMLEHRTENYAYSEVYGIGFTSDEFSRIF